jgi:hypothetical protein
MQLRVRILTSAAAVIAGVGAVPAAQAAPRANAVERAAPAPDQEAGG